MLAHLSGMWGTLFRTESLVITQETNSLPPVHYLRVDGLFNVSFMHEYLITELLFNTDLIVISVYFYM